MAGDELHWGDEIHWPTSTALYFILLQLCCQIICTIINSRGACCNICFKALHFHNLSVLLAVFTANRKYQ